MKSLLVRELRVKNSKNSNDVCKSKEFTLERVRRFKEADERLQEACARLGIEKPNMVS